MYSQFQLLKGEEVLLQCSGALIDLGCTTTHVGSLFLTNYKLVFFSQPFRYEYSIAVSNSPGLVLVCKGSAAVNLFNKPNRRPAKWAYWCRHTELIDIGDLSIHDYSISFSN